MPLTFGDARKMLAEWAGRGGKSASSDTVRLFVHEVMQHMLQSGAYGNEKTFTFQAVKGVITLPFELEVPLKVKVDDCVVGTVWDRWFEYHQGGRGYFEGDGCYDAVNALQELTNDFPTVYDLPDCGSLIGVQCECLEDEGANIIIKGIDVYGRTVYTSHRGKEVTGEYLSIKKGDLTYSTVVFKKITEVIKTKTHGYVNLFWVNKSAGLKGFLSTYSPYEETPSYRRYKLRLNCPHVARIDILGRIRLKNYYADNDRIPFDNIVALKSSAQSRNAATKFDGANMQLMEQFTGDVIERENEYKKPNVGQPIEFGGPTARPIRGIIGGLGFRGFRTGFFGR